MVYCYVNVRRIKTNHRVDILPRTESKPEETTGTGNEMISTDETRTRARNTATRTQRSQTQGTADRARYDGRSVDVDAIAIYVDDNIDGSA